MVCEGRDGDERESTWIQNTCLSCVYNTAILIIFESQVSGFQLSPSSKVVLNSVEYRFVALNYYENGSNVYLDAELEVGAEVFRHHLLHEKHSPVRVEAADPLEKEVGLNLCREHNDSADKAHHYLMLVYSCVDMFLCVFVCIYVCVCICV
jgi:hypothetical protein